MGAGRRYGEEETLAPAPRGGDEPAAATLAGEAGAAAGAPLQPAPPAGDVDDFEGYAAEARRLLAQLST